MHWQIIFVVTSVPWNAGSTDVIYPGNMTRHSVSLAHQCLYSCEDFFCPRSPRLWPYPDCTNPCAFNSPRGCVYQPLVWVCTIAGARYLHSIPRSFFFAVRENEVLGDTNFAARSSRLSKLYPSSRRPKNDYHSRTNPLSNRAVLSPGSWVYSKNLSSGFPRSCGMILEIRSPLQE